MDQTTIFVTVALAHFLALLSPGPDFLLVVKSAVKNRAGIAVGVAAGIATANALYIALCLVGVGAILSRSTAWMWGLKMAGGLFLLYLGVMALRARKSDYRFLEHQPAAGPNAHGLAVGSSFWREFLVGFASGILNPKNLLFYLSLFSLVLHDGVDMGFKLALGVWMTTVVLVWDVFIVVALSHGTVRSFFNRSAYYIDKATGAVLGAVGAKIVHSAASQG